MTTITWTIHQLDPHVSDNFVTTAVDGITFAAT